MNKKPYNTPIINKVKLVSKNTILGFCHSSPNLFPKDAQIYCQRALTGCATPRN